MTANLQTHPPLAGESIVVTGTFPGYKRQELLDEFERLGAGAAGKLSNATMLIVGDTKQSKTKKLAEAVNHSITVLTWNEFTAHYDWRGKLEISATDTLIDLLDTGADLWSNGDELDGTEPQLVELGYRLSVLSGDEGDLLGDQYGWTFDIANGQEQRAEQLAAEIRALGLRAVIRHSDPFDY